jgi:hypothetical protein
MNVGDKIKLSQLPEGAKAIGKWPCSWIYTCQEEGSTVQYFFIPIGQFGKRGCLVYGYYIKEKAIIKN